MGWNCSSGVAHTSTTPLSQSCYSVHDLSTTVARSRCQRLAQYSGWRYGSYCGPPCSMPGLSAEATVALGNSQDKLSESQFSSSGQTDQVCLRAQLRSMPGADRHPHRQSHPYHTRMELLTVGFPPRLGGACAASSPQEPPPVQQRPADGLQQLNSLGLG